MDKEQPKRKRLFSDVELSLIRNTFGNEDLLRVIQKCYLGAELSESEISILQGLSQEAKDIVKKSFNPTAGLDRPFGQNIDLLQTIEIKNISTDEAIRNVRARTKLIAILERGNKRLDNPSNELVVNLLTFDLMRDVDSYFIEDLIARNTAINHTDLILNQFVFLANEEVETPDQIAKKVKQDSAK